MDVPVIDSDSEIFSEISDGEDIDGSESTYGGHAQNILSSLDESIGKIDDRSLRPVRSGYGCCYGCRTGESFWWEDAIGELIGGRDSDDFQHYLSCIGNVIGYKDKCVEVRWASGHVSKVLIPASFSWNSECRFSMIVSCSPDYYMLQSQIWYSEEPANIGQAWGRPVLPDTAHINLSQLSCAIGILVTQVIQDINSLSITVLTFNVSSLVLVSICDGFSLLQCHDLMRKLSLQMLSKRHLISRNYQNVENNSNEDCTTTLEILRRETREFKQGEEPIVLPEEDKPIKFKQFNVVNDFSDHHFINGIGDGIMLSQVKRGWFKKVQQEWSFQKRDLPDAIYVRVYEERRELMRAAILGSPGTPYHDGLFFFDIFFPSDYPQEPGSIILLVPYLFYA
ncbi:unnamed protein product [Musa banksii]